MATPKISVSLIAVGIAGAILIVLSALITNSAEDALKKSSKAQEKKEQTSSPEVKPNELISTIRVNIGDEKFWMSVDSGEAAQEFARAIPFDIDMKDLNGNEKYYYGQDKLPTKDIYSPEQIKAGDVMLYEDNCIVIFYKDFDTTYQYVRIGRINDSERLTKLLDNGKDVNVFFTKQ